MDAALLRELQDRGRFFYERFPGAAAAEEWKRERERGEREEAARTHQGRGPPGEGKDAAGTRSSSLDPVVLTVAGNPPQTIRARGA
jgi:hypothetical protein